MKKQPFDFSAEAQATDEQLAGALAKLQALSPEQVAKMLPDPGDQAQIQQLMKTVAVASSENDKVAALRQNMAGAGSALRKLLAAVMYA